MTIRPDLHMHSTFSDGVLTPQLLVEKAASMGVTAMALTDHDSFEGSDVLRKTYTAIPVIPGVELSLRDMSSLHLLGYGVTDAPELRERVAALAHMRQKRAREMVARLEQLGMPLDWDAMTTGYSGTLGRAHVARAMVAQGYAATNQEAFDKYLGEGRPAYVPGERLSMAEALPLLRRSGFVPVLAHPALLKKDDLTLRVLLSHWKEQGLMGVEAYHPSQMARPGIYDTMARSLDLLVTGGSDYHKDNDNHGVPGSICDSWQSAGEDLRRLMDALD